MGIKLAVLLMFAVLLDSEIVMAANNLPYFDMGNIFIYVSEDAPIDSTIATIVAKDIEDDPITFSIKTMKDKLSIQSLTSTTAALKLRKQFDREVEVTYDLPIYIKDDKNAEESRKEFILIITDVNDKDPIFMGQPYMAKIPENTTVGTTIMTVSAEDRDAGSNGVVQYMFSNDSSSQTSMFEIGPVNGRLKLRAPLDYERTRIYTLIVIAVDGGTPKRQSSTPVIVNVTDISDMPPRFVKSAYLEEINENEPVGTSVVKVEGRDGDEGVNNPIVYQIVSGNEDGTFALDNKTGLITVNGAIDAEKTDLYKLTIRAMEVPDPSSNTTVTVLITVVDQNDNKPQFPQASYVYKIREDVAKPGRIVTDQLNVKDGDKNPLFRRVQYHLTGVDSEHFAIDPTSGILSINSTLDYEAQINYTFTIVVTETGTAEKFSANASVLVTLENVNDNKPVFASATYNYSLTEEVPAGTHIAQITATDADSGSFGELSYELIGGFSCAGQASYFSVDKSSGNISTTKTLDFEVLNRYQFSLLAKDGGGFYEEVAIATVTVTLRDINDNDPIFTGTPYSRDLLENLPAGTSVYRVSATDKDSGENGRISYNISAGNIGDAFTINGSGLVTTRRPLDRETVASYSLVIVAFDHGKPFRNSSTLLAVTILDENDNSPQITAGLHIFTNISEGAGGGTVVLPSIQALDPDAGDNGRLTYSMPAGDSRFTLNSATGRLQISPTGLDRELKSSYDLVINVTDNGVPPRQNSTVVHVTILDINDNTPVFDPDPAQAPAVYIVSVEEGPGTINETVIDVNATDGDDGQNGAIVYTLSGDNHGYFSLDSSTSSPARLLAGEALVTATDACARFDTEPLRERSFCACTNVQNQPISKGPQMDVTRASPASRRAGELWGVLKVRKELDRESPEMTRDATGAGRFLLDIIASDQATPVSDRKAATVQVSVIVKDINDNAPGFQSHTYSTRISEAALPGSNVIQVSASDADLEYKGKVNYNITSGDPENLFQIAPNGMILTKGSLDADHVTMYNLTVLATDGGIPPLSSKTYVTIYVDDVNDNDPVFNQSAYSASLLENSPIGTPVVRVFASDKDLGANGNVTYRITNGDKDGAFRIDNITGEVIVAGSVDREKTPIYTLTIQAEDRGQPSSRKAFTEVTVTVTDENDNYPQFSAVIYEAEVAENSGPGTIITMKQPILVTDSDIGINKDITYSLSGPGSENFVINSTTAVITCSSSVALDRERNASYALAITATDGGNKNSSAQLTVHVIDRNDESPRFSQAMYYANVSESAIRGTVIRRVTATDDDVGTNAIIYYSSSGAEFKFYVSRSTGDVIVDSPLDREYKSVYILNVTAANLVAGAQETTTQVHITVTDVIDDKPYFSTDTLTVHVSENASIGTNVTMVTALDKDFGDTLTYHMVSGDAHGQFRIDNMTGVIYTAGQLDRENSTKHILHIRAKDTAGLVSDILTVTIVPDDVNDNAPVFTRPFYAAEYWEESPQGVSILKVTATDLDAGVNADVRYSIVGNVTDYVTIGPTSGIIALGSKPLDREVSAYFNFTIQATDLGFPRESSTVHVSLRLVDINDNTPEFNETDYYAYVRENQPAGAPVLVVTATDKDLGTNAKLSYALSGRMYTRFNIDPDTGNITTREPLDREEDGASSYTLTVRAVDSAVRSREGTTRVTITVTDANDHAPVFTEQGYSFPVREDVSVGHVIGRVQTTDKDINLNARARFFISSGNLSLPFAVNATTGEITSVSLLDRETNSSFTFTITARDQGVPWLQSNTSITITITDVNDNRPVFSQDVYNVTLRESAFLKTMVTQVSANDPDKGANGQFTYKILSGDVDDVFDLDANSGLIILKSKLDHEKTPRYNLTIGAQDLGVPSLTGLANVIVLVTDVDDNAPVFHKDRYTAEIFENATRGQHVLSVNATDIDAQDSHKTVHYRIEAGNLGDVFAIGELNGSITIQCTAVGCLDRETHAQYTLQVAAISRVNLTEQKSLVPAIITILDINDVTPVFSAAHYTKDVLEDSGSITDDVILTVTARDSDADNNGLVIYSIVSGDANNAFTINNKTGAIKRARPLDREHTSFYSLVVMAADMGLPPLSSNVTVNITVLDVNDNHPELVTPPAVLIPENATMGTFIVKLNATDKDASSNGELFFSIISGNDEGVFELNETTGEIRTAKILDHEQTAQYKLTVKAQDRGTPRLSSAEKQVNIFLIDLNDNEPIFTVRKTSFSVDENLAAGAVVGIVAAQDLDSQNPIFYYITNIGELVYFVLNETTGELQTKLTLDREQAAVHYLYIKASNEKLNSTTLQPLSRRRRSVTPGVSNSTNTTQAPLPADLTVQLVEVKIGDTNDNGPKFTKKMYTGGVSQGAKHGSNVIQVLANDADAGNNSRIAYSIVLGKDSDQFDMDKESGWIKAKGSYAKLKEYEFVLQVLAADNFGKTPNYNDTATVKLYILTELQQAVLTSGRNPVEVRANIDEFIRVLQNITGYIINIDDINYYKDPTTGNYDYSKSALLFHAVDPSTKKIVDRDIVISKIDKNYFLYEKFFAEWKIKEVKPQVPEKESEEFPVVLAAVIGLGALLFIVILIFCCVVCQLRKRQKRKLRAATAASYGGSAQQMAASNSGSIPTTNLHVAEGSNPIWVDPYHNWGLVTDEEDGPYLQTFKANGKTSDPYYENVTTERANGNPIFMSQEAAVEVNADDDTYEDMNGPSSSRKGSAHRPASPEVYESSGPTSPHSLYLQDGKFQVTSI